MLPSDELGQDEFEELAGEAAAGLVRSGDVQYWQLNDTMSVFTQSALPGVWQLEIHFGERQGGDDPAAEMKALLTDFWDAQQPEYITAQSPAYWPVVCLMQQAGFQNVGILPLADGPLMTWGWRKCH